MLFYHKISKITIPILLVFIFVFSISFKTYAYTVNNTYDVTGSNGLFKVQVSSDNRVVADSYIYDDEKGIYIATFNLPVTYTVFKSAYSSFLYTNGVLRFNVRFSPTFNRPTLSSSLTYSYTVDCNPTSCYAVLYSNTYSRGVDNNSNFAVYCDNLYTDKQAQSLCVFTVNYVFTASFSDVSSVNDLYLSANSDTYEVNTSQYSLSTSVQPSAIHGLAFTISEAVSRAIYNSSIEEDLDGIHTDIEATNLILSQIKQQDYSLYNQILSSIVSQTQNDNALQQAFISFMTQQLHGSATYGFDSNMSLHIEGPIGEMVSHIWYQVIDFKTKFQQFVAANQSEAAEVNSEAASQESALSDLQQSLVVPTPAVDGVLNDLASDIANPGISSGQGDVFFYLRNPYLVKILVFVFSIGLAGFILYGKG